MTSLTKKKDLINFINNEIISSTRIDVDKILKFYCNILNKTITEIKNKFVDIDNIDLNESIISCSNLIFHIYWNLISYTNNLKLTIFLSERAILLFTEFIIMSRDPILNKELNILPNINDAISFAYKKTIGPLKIKKNENYLIDCAKQASLDIKLLCHKLINFKNIDNIKIFEISYNYILKSIFKFYQKYLLTKDYNNFIFYKINYLFDDTNINISHKLQILKTIIDNFHIMEKSNEKPNLNLSIVNNIFINIIRKYNNNTEEESFNLISKNLKKKKIYTDCKLNIERFL